MATAIIVSAICFTICFIIGWFSSRKPKKKSKIAQDAYGVPLVEDSDDTFTSDAEGNIIDE